MKSRRPVEVDLSQLYDVLVVGGGNAAICAAMTAREVGSKVLMIEVAPKVFRGGNSRHTRNLRYLHDKGNDFLTGPYEEKECWEDLLRITEGETNEHLARFTIRQSRDLGKWMENHGCKFQPSLKGTLHLSRTNAFFLGGGKALMNAYYNKARQLGVDIVYETEVQDLMILDGKFISAEIIRHGRSQNVQAKAVVLASGGFEANIPWLKESWGKAADRFLVRGCPYNKGRMLRVLLANSAKPVGDPSQCHAVAIDARGPQFDGGIVTRLDCVPFGIVVNRDGRRFYDEGEDFWPKRYAIWGRLVAGQREQTAYAIIDSKSLDQFMPSVYPPVKSESISGLASELGLDPISLEETVDKFNRSIKPGTLDPAILDNCTTEGLDPPKSHWALPIDSSPFYGYPLRPGITFTYLGLTVNEQAQVLFRDDYPSPNIFAAGEIMAGNILGKGYMAGFGLTIGTVFGRIAGKEAAHYAIG